MILHTRFLACVLIVLAVGCDNPMPGTDSGLPPTDGGGSDGSTRDAGRYDAGPIDIAPIFRNAVALPDDELATQALRLMGAPEAGGSGSCSNCHGITRQNIRGFWDLSDAAWRTCFSDLAVETPAAAQSIVDCFQDTAGLYRASRLGVFATGANFAWFEFVFRRALGTGWEAEYERFRAAVVQAPDGEPQLTQAEFDLLTEWFLRGTPRVETILPIPDGTGECTPFVDASVAEIVAEGALTGWSARNREATILMHGCAGATNPRDCLSTYPRPSDTAFGAGWEIPAGTTQRILFEVPYNSFYWTKCSADGRFVGHGMEGGAAGASIIDLARGFAIPADGAYDPGFFPDNSAFMFQGTGRGPAICMQTVLTAGNPTQITFNEPGCTSAGSLELYQHVGAALDGDDYWVVNSRWAPGDPGDDNVDPYLDVTSNATVTLHRLTNTLGTGFVEAGSFNMPAPWQANAVISPTMRLLVTQIGDGAANPIGYAIHRIDLTRNATGGVTSVAIPEVARYCYPGGKAAVSLDDRWLVTHHRATDADAVDLGFTGPGDPGFAQYRGISNIYLIDTATGERIRITHMQPGQRALFPHFRSDGWVYFLVRDGTLPEYIVASDAGIVLR